LRALADGGGVARLLDKVKEIVPECRLECWVKAEAAARLDPPQLPAHHLPGLTSFSPAAVPGT
jgi:hypothetical protein